MLDVNAKTKPNKININLNFYMNTQSQQLRSKRTCSTEIDISVSKLEFRFNQLLPMLNNVLDYCGR